MSRRWAFVVAGISVALIFWATLMPVGQKNALLSAFPVDLHADKVGHFLGFALLGWSLQRTGAFRWPWSVVVAGGLLGALTEALQFLADGRVPLVTDVGIDALGVCLGLVTAIWFGHKGGSSGPPPSRG
jgi:VanZ family protein